MERREKIKGINSLRFPEIEKVYTFLNLREILILLKVSRNFRNTITNLGLMDLLKKLKRDKILNHKFEEFIKKDGIIIKKANKTLDIDKKNSLLIFCGLFLKSFTEIHTDSLDENKKRKEISLSASGVKDSLPYISHLLLNNSNYIKINLSNNDIDVKYFISAHFFNNISFVKNLKTINLSDNKIKDQGCKLLFHAIENLKFISFVDISRNSISYEGADAISNFLAKSKSINTLNLEHNILGPKGMKVLSYGLIQNDTIKTLNISYNGITAEGTKSLTTYLKQNNKISTLYYGGNYLQSDGVNYLIEGIKANISIIYLFLDWSHMGITGAHNIANILATHYYIITLDLSKNQLD
jgi:hypothetical protein